MVPSFQLPSYSCETTHEPDQTTHPSYKGSYAKKDYFNLGKFTDSPSRVPQPATPVSWRGSTEREQSELGTAQTSTHTQKTFTQLEHLHN